jgi:hypothetical protein
MSRKTYRVGRRIHRHWPFIIVLASLAVITGVSYAMYRVVSYVPPPSEATVVVTPEPSPAPKQSTPNEEEKQPFKFDTQSVGWDFLKHTSDAYNIYSYGTTDLAGGKHYLDIYVDKIPAAMAVNRLVRVAPDGANGAKLTYGKVSEPCQTLPVLPQPSSQGTSGSSQTTTVKWDGVEFTCNKQITDQNTVGTSTLQGVRLELAGKTMGKHAYFFIYTDNSSKPDYDIFYKALASFESL